VAASSVVTVEDRGPTQDAVRDEDAARNEDAGL
jgi:hypothetical protein